LALTLSLTLTWALGLRIGDLRQPRIKPRDGVVELAGDALLARGIVALRRLRNPLDLAGDRIEPLMDVGNVAAWRRRRGGIAEIGRRGVAKCGVEPVVQRHAGTACGGLCPFA